MDFFEFLFLAQKLSSIPCVHGLLIYGAKFHILNKITIGSMNQYLKSIYLKSRLRQVLPFLLDFSQIYLHLAKILRREKLDP